MQSQSIIKFEPGKTSLESQILDLSKCILTCVHVSYYQVLLR